MPSPRKKTAPRRRAPARGEALLVLIPRAAVRDEWLGRLDAVRKEEKRLKEKLSRSQHDARRAYAAWFHEHFASLQADLQKAAEDLTGCRVLVTETKDLQERLGVPAWRAYAIVKGWEPDPTGTLERLRNGEESEDEFGGGDFVPDSDSDEDLDAAHFEFQEQFGRLGAEARKRMREAMVRSMMQMFGLSRRQAEMGYDAEEAEQEKKRAAWKARQGAGPEADVLRSQRSRGPEESREQQARARFRILARRLHPDAGADPMDERTTAIWHEAQAAYERTDVESLDALLWETDSDAAARDQAPVSVVVRVLRAVEARIRNLRSQWSALRSSPVIRFAEGTARAREKLRREIAGELAADLESTLALQRQMRWSIDAWDLRWKQELVQRERRAAAKVERERIKRERAAARVRGQAELRF